MGYTRSTAADWTAYSSSYTTKSTAEIFTSSTLNEDLNPLGVTMRESRDSELNPESTPIIVGVDVTGSMGSLSEKLVRTGLETLFTEILDRKPVTDPQLMSMGIGDATMWDTAPLQVSQFEADTTAAEWLEKIFIEGGGGGNSFESYDLPYYFAANHTSHDAFEKRNKKGYIFTMGDEFAPPVTSLKAVRKFINEDGDGLQADIPFKEVIEQASKTYHCFHLIIAEGSNARYHPDETRASWQEAMGQNAIWLDDYQDMAETIVSIIQVTEGADKEEVAASWDGSTSMTVANAIKDLDAAAAFNDAMGVVKL